MKTRYIQLRTGAELETVDEFPYNTKEERTEARKMLREYQTLQGHYYMSSRPCKHWKN